MRGFLMGVLAGVVSVLAVCLSSVAGVAFASGEVCPNAAVRTGVSAHLPSCRGYEMVSPVFKGGYGATSGVSPGYGGAPSGEAYVFNELGRFAGSPANESASSFYVARRGPEGWLTSPISAPPQVGYTAELGEDVLFSPSLDDSAAFVGVAENVGSAVEGRSRFAVELHPLAGGDEPASFSALGAPFEALVPGATLHLETEAASADLSHLVLHRGEDGAPLVAADTDAFGELYDVSSSGVSLVGVDGEGNVLAPQCDVRDGNGRFSVSPAGSRVFFQTGVGPSVVGGPTGGCEDQGLFVRVDDSKTLEVSKPEGALECGAGVAGVSEVCSGADRGPVTFEAANWDGSLVYFTTPSALVSGDTNSSSDLYMARIGEEGGQPAVRELVQVSHDPREGVEAGEAQRVIAMNASGSHVYYVARGVLAGENAEGASPIGGAENLYLYDAGSGVTTFIADFCSGPELSGSIPDPRCNANLTTQAGFTTGGGRATNDSEFWNPNEGGNHLEAQVNECAEPASSTCEPGRFLVFSSYARLTEDDVNGARQVFRYDARTGTIVRVSKGENGFDDNGNQPFHQNERYEEGDLHGEIVANATVGEENSDRFGGGQSKGSASHPLYEYESQNRMITEDGSRIVFSTDARLSPFSLNQQPDIYEWHEGKVGLVSSGSSPSADTLASISPSGRDLFFATSAGLVAQDTEGDNDIYDARIDGGFSHGESQEPCSGDACQGPLSTPAPLLVPGSVSQPGGGNFSVAPVVTAAKPKTKSKPKPKPKGKGKKHGKAKTKHASTGRKAHRASRASKRGTHS